MKSRRSKWAALLAVMVGMALAAFTIHWATRLHDRVIETEAELRARLTPQELEAVVTWARHSLPAATPESRWSADALPAEIRRLDARWAAASEFGKDKYIYIHFSSPGGNSGLCVAAPTAAHPSPPAKFSPWSPGVWYSRD